MFGQSFATNHILSVFSRTQMVIATTSVLQFRRLVMGKYRYLYWYQLPLSTECHMSSVLVWLNSKVGISKFSPKFTENSPKICYYLKKFFLNILKFPSFNFFHNFSNVSQELCRGILQFLPKFFATNF